MTSRAQRSGRWVLSTVGVGSSERWQSTLITQAYGLTTAGAGLIGSASLVGMFVGGLVFGYVTDRVGRQKVYLADIAAFILLSVLQFFATEPWQLVALRFGMGIAIGADFAIAGTIASEFAPQKARGPLLVVMVTMWSVGAAFAYIVGWAMVSRGPSNRTSTRWPVSLTQDCIFNSSICRARLRARYSAGSIRSTYG